MLFLYVSRFDETTRKQFSDFYDMHYFTIQRALKKWFPQSLSSLREDCEQEIWIQCSKSFDRILLLEDDKRKRYVVGIARNTIKDFLYKEFEFVNHSSELSVVFSDTVGDPSSLLDFLDHEIIDDVANLLKQLPDNMHYTLELHYLDHLSTTEIAEKFNVSEAAIYKRIERSLEELNLILRKQGGYLE